MITPKYKQIFTKSNQSGFTLIESLMAVVVVSILMAAIAPAIGLSVATRVQARRVELASQAARSYIDGVKAGTITAPSHSVASSGFANTAPPTSTGSLSCTAPTPQTTTPVTPIATTNYYCRENTATLNLFCINGDEMAGCTTNSVRDLVIQSFRTGTDENYKMGVRVYRAEGFKTAGAFDNPNPKDSNFNPLPTQQSTFTGGLGKLRFPLLQTTTEITGNQPKYQDYCDRILNGCR